jgi:rare lipoprotein A
MRLLHLTALSGLGLMASIPAFAKQEERGTHIGTGHASYYAQKFHGRRTASGETFSTSALTAAHRTIRFGSRVRVTNLSNGKSVVVRINDRGPFVRGRLIDLSPAAARHIGLHHSGTALVRLSLIGD